VTIVSGRGRLVDPGATCGPLNVTPLCLMNQRIMRGEGGKIKKKWEERESD